MNSAVDIVAYLAADVERCESLDRAAGIGPSDQTIKAREAHAEAVLMQGVIEANRAWLFAAVNALGDYKLGGKSNSLENIRAGTLDLLKQATEPAVGYGNLGSTGVHFVSDDRNDCVEESHRDGSTIVELIVRPRIISRR